MNNPYRNHSDLTLSISTMVTISTIAILFACSGCLHTAALVTKPTPISRVAAPSIQSTPDYRQAALQYEHNKFKESLATIETLLTRPNLSPSDRDFLERQRELCKDALTPGRKAVAKSSPAPQTTAAKGDCGPKALAFVLEGLGVKATSDALGKAAGTTQFGTTIEGLAKAAKMVGVMTEGVQMDRNALKQLDKRAVAWVDGDHYIAVLKVSDDTARIHDPNHPREETIETEELLRRSGGVMLLVQPVVKK